MGGPIIFPSAPFSQVTHLLSTSWHEPAPAESMSSNILLGFHFAEKVISNFITKSFISLGGKDIKTQRVRLS